MIDKALGLVQGMMCQATKNGKAGELPAAGSTAIDYQADLATALSEASGITVDSATISRLEDQNSRPVYRSDIVITMGTSSMELHLVHSPASESDNNSYNGVLWSKTTSGTSLQGAGPTDQYVSVQYAKTTDADGNENIQAELLRANLTMTSAISLLLMGSSTSMLGLILMWQKTIKTTENTRIQALMSTTIWKTRPSAASCTWPLIWTPQTTPAPPLTGKIREGAIARAPAG